MNPASEPYQNWPVLYYRIVAAWILCEAMLGGLIHGLHIPVSGLLVGSASVICISLIAWHVPVRGAILRATLIVVIFKMMLSPQAPFPAYFAVFFQGLLGEWLFRHRTFFKAKCYALALASLVESALQRILLLTLVYGNDLWKVVDETVSRAFGRGETISVSLWVAIAYIAIHIAVGIAVGYFCTRIPATTSRFQDRYFVSQGMKGFSPGKKRRPGLLFFIFVALLAIYLQATIPIGTPLFSPSRASDILVRSALILLAWFGVVSPALKWLMKRWMDSSRKRWAREMEMITSLLPEMQSHFYAAWRESGDEKGWKRLRAFRKNVLLRIFGRETGISILSGPIASGKTSALKQILTKHRSVAGILTPREGTARVFHDIARTETFPMLASADDREAIHVGKFRFSKKSFEKAAQILEGLQSFNGAVVIDEIGPLELRGGGFDAALRKLLANPPRELILVVRESLLAEVIQHYRMPVFERLPYSSLPNTLSVALAGEKSS